MEQILERNGTKGYDVAPDWLKEKYRQAVSYTCQACHKHEKEVGTLQAHRLIRGEKGGLYTIVPLNHIDNNIKVLCRACHTKLHGNEWSNCKGK